MAKERPEKLINVFERILIQALKSSEKSTLIAHAVAQVPNQLMMILGAKDLTWTLDGLRSSSSNIFNIGSYGYAQVNEVADLTAREGKEWWNGISDILQVRAHIGKAPLSTTKKKGT